MAGRVIDELVTIIRYNTSNRELLRAEQQVNDFTRNTQKRFQSWGQTINKVSRALTVAIGAAGAGSFGVGAAEERSFLNLQTQLGDTEEKMNELKDVAKGVSKETNRPLKELGDAIFAIRSGGQKGAAGLDILNQSAKAAAAGLGETRPIALLAGSAVNAYGEAALSGSDAVDKLLAIVESGNIEASTLAEPMTKLLSIGPGLGVTFDELGASVAAYTQLVGNASQAVTGVQQALSALQKPTGEAEVLFTNAYGSIQNMHKAIREDGFLNVLQRLHESVDGDAVAMGRMFSSVEALGFVTDVTTLRTDKYAEALDNVTNSGGKVNKGFDIYANSSVANADRATNNLRLALSSLYNNVLAPLLQLFGKLPSAIQVVVLGMGAMQIASTIGLGPSVGGLVTSLARFIVALKTGTIWNSNFILSLRMAAISAGQYVAKLKIAAVATKVFRGVMLITAGAARLMWAAITGPIGLVIAGLAVVGFVVYKFRRQILGALKAVWNFIKGNWQEIAGLLLLPILGPFALIATNAFGLRDKLLGVFKGIWNWFRDSPVFGPLIDGATQAIEMIKTLLDWAGKIEGAFSWVKSKLGFGEDEGDPNAPRFGRGGMVPGPTGRPLAAVVHGGEMILPPDVARVMSNLMRGPASTPSALYPVPALAGPTYSTQTMSKASEINIEFSGDIVINAPHGSDPQEIARIVNEEIGERFRDVVHNFDDGILR